MANIYVTFQVFPYVLNFHEIFHSEQTNQPPYIEQLYISGKMSFQA